MCKCPFKFSRFFFFTQKVAELVLHLADLRAAGDGGDGVLHGGDGAARLPPQRQLLRRARAQPREPTAIPTGHACAGKGHCDKSPCGPTL